MREDGRQVAGVVRGLYRRRADGVYNTIDAIGGTTGPRVGQYFCLPPDIRAQQMTDAVRKYIAENPKLADYNASTAVSLGLGKAFPCRSGN